MRKDEFLYLHQLLAEVRRTLAARGVAHADPVAETVSPVAAHASKAEHELAVIELATVLAAATAAESESDRQGPDRPRQTPS